MKKSADLNLQRHRPQDYSASAIKNSTRFCAIETMERRVLLSAVPNFRQGPLAKIGDPLAALYQQNRTPGANIAVSSPLLHIHNGTVQIEAYAMGGGKRLAKAIKKLHATDIHANGRAIAASVPIDKLKTLAKLPGLRFATPALYTTNAGSTMSQGDQAQRADLARNTYGLSGAGVKVGIIADSFNTSANSDKYANDIASGDLPANVQILQDHAGGTDEGRAMAQVIYDSAPGASLAFDTGAGGQNAMASAINALRIAGANAIVDDFTYYDEPMFQDGVIAQAAQSAVFSGVTYISAVGNQGQQAYENTWSAGNVRLAGSIPSADGAPLFYGGTSFNFAPSGQPVNDLQSFTLAPNASILLSFQWDSPYFSAGGVGSPNSMDAYVLNADGTQIVGGSANEDVGKDPIQVFQFTNTTGSTANFNLMLVNETGPTPGYLKYVDFSGQATNWGYTTHSGSAFGHANAAGVESVAAASWNNTPPFGVTPAVAEANSSWGTTPILFDHSGNRLATPIIRQTPAITAPDGVANTFFGSVIDGQHAFCGTSAAAASTAAVAALLLQKNPGLTPAQVDTALNSTAADMGAAGYDFQTGYGLIQADHAVASILGNVSGTVFQDNNGNAAPDAGEIGVGGVTVYVDANNNGVLNTGENSTTTDANGNYTLTNVPIGSAVIREVLPGGYVAVNGAQTINIPGGGSISGVNFGLFPNSFSATGGNANYLLQVDPTKSQNIDLYMGGSLAYTAAKSILSALAFRFSGNNNQLAVSFLYGNPVPAGGMTASVITVGASGNTLVLNGSTGADTASINFQTTTFNGTSIFQSGFQSQILNGDSGNDTFNMLNAQPSSESLTFNGGPGNDSLTIKYALPNNGTTTFFNGGTTATDHDTLTVNGGTFPLSGDPAATSANLTVNDNSAVTFTPADASAGINARHLAALNIGPTAIATVSAPPAHDDRAVLVVGSLSIASGGKIDLGGNDLIVHNGNLPALNGLLASGLAAGSWNGPGINSSAAHNDPLHLTALGILQNTTDGSTPAYSTFDGQTGLLSTDVFIKYTWYGDADLSGKVDGTDYSIIDHAFIANQANPGSIAGWWNGDFNYDGKIDGSDYSLIDNAFNMQRSAPG